MSLPNDTTRAGPVVQTGFSRSDTEEGDIGASPWNDPA